MFLAEGSKCYLKLSSSIFFFQLFVGAWLIAGDVGSGVLLEIIEGDGSHSPFVMIYGRVVSDTIKPTVKFARSSKFVEFFECLKKRFLDHILRIANTKKMRDRTVEPLLVFFDQFAERVGATA